MWIFQAFGARSGPSRPRRGDRTLIVSCRLAAVLLAFSLLAGAVPQAEAAAAAAAQSRRPASRQDAPAGFAARVRQAVASGELSREQGLLYRFQHVFDRGGLPARWRPAESPGSAGTAGGAEAGADRPAKDLTGLIAEFARLRAALPKETVARIEGYLAEPAPATFAIVSPSGRFRLDYSLEGRHAVPAEDVSPADGVPDYVQRIARYLDRSWRVLVDSLGMAAPVLAPAYRIGFEAMDAYGYTIPTGDGRTRIVMHSSYLGFPANDDPEGSRWGAARVTAAHELQHACQYEATRWSEEGWGELDATWAEDVVFDQVNDYVNYLHQGSPLSDPEQPLDHGGTGSYEDCIWQRWLSENHPALVPGLWRARRERPRTPMLESYAAALTRAGSSLAEAWAGFGAWNWLTGSRAVAGAGYEEAAAYPQPRAATTLTAYPAVATGSLDHLAATYVVCEQLPPTGRLRVRLQRSGGTGLALTAILRPRDRAALIQRVPVRAGQVEDILWLPLEDLDQIALAITNSGSGTAADGAAWSLEVEVVEGEAAAAPAAPVLHGCAPNPFNPSTRIEFTLGRATVVRLEVLDIAGRRVRVLWEGELPAGRHALVWDGRDRDGQPAPAGIYLACLSGEGRRQSHRMTLLR